MMNNEIVFIKKQQALTSSRIVAEKFEKEHKAILREIRNILKKESLKDFGRCNFAPTTYKDIQGKKQPEYLMTKNGFYFLVMGFTGEKADSFKIAFIEAFDKMERTLQEISSDEWKQARIEGKVVRNNETDAIKELTEYAKAQGSEHSDMLYMNYSKLANSIVGIKVGERNKATFQQLIRLQLVEGLIQDEVKKEIQKGTPYKDIYRSCKGNLEEINNKFYGVLKA